MAGQHEVRKYYPPGLYETIIDLRRQQNRVDHTSYEFVDLGGKWQATQKEADLFLREKANEKSHLPPVAERVKVTTTIKTFLGPQEVVGDTEFTKGEVDEIKTGRVVYDELAKYASQGSGVERDFIIKSGHMFPALVKRDPESSEISLEDRKGAVWPIFYVARAAETSLLAPEDRFFPLRDESKGRLEILRDLPDKLIAHPPIPSK